MKHSHRLLSLAFVLCGSITFAARPEPRSDIEKNKVVNACMAALDGRFRKVHKLKVRDAVPGKVENVSPRSSFVVFADRELPSGRHELRGFAVSGIDSLSPGRFPQALSPSDDSWLNFELNAKEYRAYLETSKVSGMVDISFKSNKPTPVTYAQENTLLKGDVIKSGRVYWLVLSRRPEPNWMYDVGDFDDQVYTALKFNRLPQPGATSSAVETFKVSGNPYPQPDPRNLILVGRAKLAKSTAAGATVKTFDEYPHPKIEKRVWLGNYSTSAN